MLIRCFGTFTSFEMLNRLQKPSGVCGVAERFWTQRAVRLSHPSGKRMASWESAISTLYGNSGPKTVKSYNVAINACGKGNQWQLAVFLLEDLKVRTFQPDIVTLNSLISACREQWLLALHLLHEMIQGYSVDVISFSAAIRACERAGVWLALSLLQQMKEQMLQINVIVHNSVLSVFSQAGEWERALLWLRNMKDEQMACTTISYNTAITACARSAQWLQAIHLLSFESFESVSTDIISYNAAINSCEDSGLWELALQLYGQLQESFLQRNVVTFGSIISTCGNGSRWEVAMYFLQELQSSDLQANLITLNASLMACELSQRWSTALQLLQNGLNTTLIPNIVSFNVAISTCGKAGQMLLVRRLLLRLNRLGLEPTESHHLQCSAEQLRGDLWLGAGSGDAAPGGVGRSSAGPHQLLVGVVMGLCLKNERMHYSWIMLDLVG